MKFCITLEQKTVAIYTQLLRHRCIHTIRAEKCKQKEIKIRDAVLSTFTTDIHQYSRLLISGLKYCKLDFGFSGKN